MLCDAIKGRTLRKAVSVLQRYPQAKENVPVATMALTVPVLQEVERMNEALQGTGVCSSGRPAQSLSCVCSPKRKHALKLTSSVVK